MQESHQAQRQRRFAAPRKRRRGRFMRFFKGYLMFVGALTTLYVLVQLLVLLFIEIGKWMPPGV